MWTIYKDIKLALLNSKCIQINIIGSDIGLGCNGIHFLDLFSYMCNNFDFILNGDLLDNKIIPSKREGYKEFTGTLNCFSSNGCMLSITSFKEPGIPLMVQINSDHIQCQILEQEGKAFISCSDNDWKWKEIDFTVPFQSQLTQIVLQQLINTGSCELTTFKESCKLHIPFINILIKHCRTQLNKVVISCPIT
jgi:hypothetical protein